MRQNGFTIEGKPEVRRARHQVHAADKLVVRRERHQVHAAGKRLFEVYVPTKNQGQRYRFAAPRAERFAQARYLEAVFIAYTIGIGCTVRDGEITATAEQAKLLRSWWEEHRL